MLSLILFLYFPNICKTAEHLGDSDIVPLFCLLTAELGEYFGHVLILIRYHILGTLRYVHIDVFIEMDKYL